MAEKKRGTVAIVSTTLAVGVFLIGGFWAIRTAPQPAPTSTSIVGEVQESASPTTTQTPTATPTPTAEPVVVEPPVVEPVVEEPVEEEPVDPGPVLCPAGSTSNSSDGYNDTSCYPDICFSIAVPDSAHPECDAAFKP